MTNAVQPRFSDVEKEMVSTVILDAYTHVMKAVEDTLDAVADCAHGTVDANFITGIAQLFVDGNSASHLRNEVYIVDRARNLFFQSKSPWNREAIKLFSDARATGYRLAGEVLIDFILANAEYGCLVKSQLLAAMSKPLFPPTHTTATLTTLVNS